MQFLLTIIWFAMVIFLFYITILLDKKYYLTVQYWIFLFIIFFLITVSISSVSCGEVF